MENLLDWFNPKKVEHITAWKYLMDNGVWPENFLPKDIIIPSFWNELLTRKLARYWVDYMLLNTTRKELIICKECGQPYGQYNESEEEQPVVTNLCAYTTNPNTPETDQIYRVMHTVEGVLNGVNVRTSLLAVDPISAIEKAVKLPLSAWEKIK
jgi:hypothetical protein